MCMMNDVDPLAATRKSGLEAFEQRSHKKQCASGHQPGKGRRTDQAAVPEAQRHDHDGSNKEK